jgi:hypothetical protein
MSAPSQVKSLGISWPLANAGEVSVSDMVHLQSTLLGAI